MKQQPQQRRAIASVERILDATSEILASQGLEAVNTNRVAEQAGLTVPTVYRYFHNKHELLAALAERFTAQEAAWMRELLASQAGSDIDGWVDALLEGYFARLNEVLAVIAACERGEQEQVAQSQGAGLHSHLLERSVGL